MTQKQWNAVWREFARWYDAHCMGLRRDQPPLWAMQKRAIRRIVEKSMRVQQR